MVLFRTKKRKQRLEINKLENVTTEKKDVEIILKRDETTVIRNSDQPPYAKTLTELSLHIQSEELPENLNQNSTLPAEYSEIELIQDDSKHALPSKPPRYVSLSDPMSHKEESSTMYQSMDQHCDPSCTTHVPQENDICTDPDTTSSHIVEADSVIYETVYSEPIQPSLFTAVQVTLTTSRLMLPSTPFQVIYLGVKKCH